MILVRAQWTVFSIVRVLHKPQNDLLYTVYFFSYAQAEGMKGGRGERRKGTNLTAVKRPLKAKED